MTALVRVAVAVALVAAIVVVARTARRVRHERESARTALLEAVRAETASVTDTDRRAVEHVESWLLRLSRGGMDPVDEVRTPDNLRALLARQLVYVRGPLTAFTSPAGIDEAAKTSGKDALLSCLVDPPTSRAEKALLAKVRATYGGDATADLATANARRMRHAQVGLPFLLPAFTDAIRAATDVEELRTLKQRFARAPLALAKQALRAEVLIVGMDDEASATGPTELDGERAHDVLVAIVDLRADRLLLRARRRADPGGFSERTRLEHARGLASCALGLDVREGIGPRGAR